MDHSPDQIPEAGLREILLWVLRRRFRFTVVNPSMFPILKPGDQVLVDPRAYARAGPEVGDIIVADPPKGVDRKIIKRVTWVHPDGSLNLEGENIFETTDYRGVPAGKIVGKVTSVFYRARERDG